MLSVLAVWAVIWISSYILGLTVLHIVRHADCATWDMCILLGLMVLTVYAEYFSLFYKVAALAWIILLVILVVCCLFLRHRDCRIRIFPDGVSHRSCAVRIAMALAILIVGLVWTSRAPEFGDTYLYHAQAIRWIEEYGVVPGLGNLHNRFAYNSAFMPLQALFSFKWLCGQSLHSVNGFVCTFFSIWAVVSMNPDRQRSIANWLRIAVLAYALMNRTIFSSTTSDMLALLAMIWISARWIENDEEPIEHYITLFLIGVYAITVKLTIAGILLLAVYPLVCLIQERQCRPILLTTLASVVIVLPYLVRNVIISGYLLYPYSSLDLFDVDWKMLSSVVDYDSMTITVWGRSTYDVSTYADSILTWAPTWFRSYGLFYQAVILVGFACAIVVGILSILRAKQDLRFSVMAWANLAGLLLWFCGAPLMRYGMAFLLVFPCILAGMIRQDNLLLKGIYYVGLPLYLLSMLVTYRYWGSLSPVIEQDYIAQEGTPVEQDGITYWIPVGDIGYHLFPSTPHRNQLNIIELRGEDLSDGFRIRESYQDSHINSDGVEW